MADTIDGNEQLIIESFKEFEKKHPDIASRTFYITLDENSEEAAHNAQLCQQLFINLLRSVEMGTKFHNDPYYLAVPVAEDEESLACDVKLITCPQYSFAEGGVAFWDVGIGEKQYIVIFPILGNGIPEIAPLSGSTNITVDSSLSTSSTNPVQNKVVTEAIKNVVPTFGITKTQGFAEYFLALTANQGNPNMYPRGIVLYEDAQSEVDNVIGLNNGTEIGIEFSVAEKRYRWVFNQASGAFIREEQISSGSSTAGGLETRSFKSTNSTADKEWNKETISLFLEGKVSIVYPYPTPNGGFPEGTGIVLMPNTHIYENGTHQFWFTEQHTSGGYTNYLIAIQSDGTYDDDIEVFKPDTEMYDTSTNLVQNKVIKKYVDGKIAEIPVVTVDSELSDTSENTVQNKVIKAYVDTEVAKKVDKVSGKGLSTEDFTTALKTKLSGLNNYDDTAIQNAITNLTNQLNTLVSGNASTAINSFNEIVAFLNGISDSESLDNIISSIESQIAAKQEKLVSGTSIKTINGDSILGEGNITVSVADEVYIGTTPPTDENVTIWIDPSETFGDVAWDGLTVDEELSPTSTNPVQNKTLYAILEQKLGGIDELLDEING